MRRVIAVVALMAVATPAAAQSTSVGGSLVFDLARFDKVEFDNDLPRITGGAASADGEALGFHLRIGRAIGERWGLEFEFARSGAFDNSVSYNAPFLTDFTSLLPGVAILPLPEFRFELETEQRFTNYGAWAWVRQDLGGPVDLTYLGGLMFTRTTFEQELRVTDPRLMQWISVLPDMSMTEYSISPAVGIDAGFNVSDRAAVTAGFRLHGAAVGGRTGLLLRPNIGLRWTF